MFPAFFWLLIVEKAYIRTLILVLGYTFSMSLGAALFLLLILPVLLLRNWKSIKDIGFILLTILAVCAMYIMASSSLNRYYAEAERQITMLEQGDKFGGTVDLLSKSFFECVEGGDSKEACKSRIIGSLSTSISGKAHSLSDRLKGLVIVWEYLTQNIYGTGAGLGIITVNNPISVGYAIAILEAGIFGGIFYVCLYAIMGFLCLKRIVLTRGESFNERVELTVFLSVCAALMMGAQRMQPDISFWHMWLYAMCFYLLYKKGKTSTKNAQQL